MHYIASGFMVERNFIATMSLGHPGSFHNVMILRHSQLYHERQTRFDHTIDYFEYLLGDLGYKGEDIFVMIQMGVHKVPPSMDDLILNPTTRCMQVTKCKWNGI